MKNSKIVAFFNLYNNTLDDFINSLNSESLDWSKLLDEKSCNSAISKSNLADLSEGDCSDKKLSDQLLWLAPKTKDSQLHQHYIVIPQARYKKSQKGEKTIEEIR